MQNFYHESYITENSRSAFRIYFLFKILVAILTFLYADKIFGFLGKYSFDKLASIFLSFPQVFVGGGFIQFSLPWIISAGIFLIDLILVILLLRSLRIIERKTIIRLNIFFTYKLIAPFLFLMLHNIFHNFQIIKYTFSFKDLPYAMFIFMLLVWYVFRKDLKWRYYLSISVN
jgi:hypothetical protein